MTPILLEEGNLQALEQPVSAEMDKGIKHLDKELVSLRTGKAHVGMLDGIRVDAYGTSMALKEVASISAPDSNLLTIQPWDKGLMSDIEKAILNSHVGITPNVDSDMIRLEVPRMTTERREEMAKTVGKKVEDCKISIRTVRKDAHNMIREAVKNKTVSEDFAVRLNKTLQDITDQFTKLADTIGDKKKSELRAI